MYTERGSHKQVDLKDGNHTAAVSHNYITPIIALCTYSIRIKTIFVKIKCYNIYNAYNDCKKK